MGATPTELMKRALERGRRGRLEILDAMNETISEPREEPSEYAPRIINIQINPDKIGKVIGSGGKTIRGMQDETGAEINVEDSGIVTIASRSAEGGKRAQEMVEELTQEPEVGKIYEGPVKNTTSFGAFIEILPGTEGLCHISELEEQRTENTTDIWQEGDTARVKLLSINEKGQLRLSRKAALEEA